MFLKIDNRERGLLPFFKNAIIESLKIGDIQICEDEKILCVFERKTISDLESSIRDGRYHEQKSRLVSNVPRNNICYIIEGDISTAKDSNTVFGSILNTMYRDKIFVYKSSSISDTANFISALWERIKKDPTKWKEYFAGNNSEECNIVDPKVYKNSTKSKNITKQIVFINSLNNINGCSSNIATVIYEKYKTMKTLVKEFESSKNPENMLKDLAIGTRKLGPVLSKRIYEFIMLE